MNLSNFYKVYGSKRRQIVVAPVISGCEIEKFQRIILLALALSDWQRYGTPEKIEYLFDSNEITISTTIYGRVSIYRRTDPKNFSSKLVFEAFYREDNRSELQDSHWDIVTYHSGKWEEILIDLVEKEKPAILSNFVME